MFSKLLVSEKFAEEKMGALLGYFLNYFSGVLPPLEVSTSGGNEEGRGKDKEEEEKTAGICTIYTSDPRGKDAERMKTLCREVLGIPVLIRALPFNSDDRPEKRSTSVKYSLVVVIGHGGRNEHTGKSYVRTGRSGRRLYAADSCFDEGIRPLIIFFSICAGGFNCPMYKLPLRSEKRKCRCVLCMENPRDFFFSEYNDLRLCTSTSLDSPFIDCVCKSITADPRQPLTSIILAVNNYLSDRENQVSDTRMTLGNNFCFKE
jgi:hypothetical protein